MVTELGRQPWIVQGVMRTADALTPMPGLVYTLAAVVAVYAVLGVVVVALMRRMVADTQPRVR
jgi:cytochrome d ubiquinol oxidase subunit I